MSDEAFADLKEALAEALAHERGERRDLPVRVVVHSDRDDRIRLISAHLTTPTEREEI
ncbi:MAG TPA: hypothetical protein VFH31_21450 [Pyrinomonadaceae bacterium]|nr:hypothetical protein [Pyrinomonadaceae bacterium]